VPDDDSLADDIAAGAAEMVPVVGPILGVFGKRLSRSMREEWARNSSKALRAAERISGLSREELADHISVNPRLIPLTTRVLYAAGMTGQDPILRALGAALGEAVRDPQKIDESEILLIGMTELRAHHIVILEVMTENPPTPRNAKSAVQYWVGSALADKSGYSRDVVNMCIAGLVRSGLISQAESTYGVSYEITDLGRTALEVLDDLNEAPSDSQQP
jgi:hypothetical protein